MAKRRWRRVRLAIAALCIAAGLGLLGLYRWATHVTASDQPRVHWRGQLPGLDLGVDTQPAAVGQGGYVEV
jgi:hypothetical protein